MSGSFATVLLAAATASTHAGPAPGQPAPPAARSPTAVAAGPTAVARDVSALLEPVRAAHDVPALAGAIVTTNGLQAVGACGNRAPRAGPPVTIADRWHIGSCTKSMTASLCAVLVEEKLFTWDSTLAALFPDLAGAIHHSYGGVTLADLLRHRAGLPEGTGDAALWSRLWAHEGPPQAARREAVEHLLSRPAAFAPGSFHYSNYGYLLAGHAAEIAAREPFERLIETRLFAPLGMTTSGWGAPGAAGEPADQPWGHVRGAAVEPGPRADNPPALSPAGRLHLGLQDWARYAAWHLRAGAAEAPLLSVESFQALHATPPGHDYAMGWGRPERQWAGGRTLTHAGSNTMWYAVIWLAPQRGFGVVVACNEAGEQAQRAVDRAASALIQDHLKAAAAEDGPR